MKGMYNLPFNLTVQRIKRNTALSCAYNSCDKKTPPGTTPGAPNNQNRPTSRICRTLLLPAATQVPVHGDYRAQLGFAGFHQFQFRFEGIALRHQYFEVIYPC